MKEEFYDKYKVIGVNVREFRDQADLSQDELAAKCSVNRAKISKIENARKDYMFSTLLEVCKALDKTLEIVIKKHPEFDNDTPYKKGKKK